MYQSSNSRALALAVFAVGLGLDLATKEWAAAALMEPVRIADWFYLIRHQNTGMFLGTVPVSVWYWIGVCAATWWFGWRALRSTSTPFAICLAAALSGLAGNAIGQAQGAVVDFIALGPITGDLWLVANIADLAMVSGVLALAFFLLRERAVRTQPRS